MNLRKDHYRVHALTGRSPTLEYIPLLLWRAAVSWRWLWLTVPARGPKLFFFLVMSEYYKIIKTFNNGSLGSGIDEERSEMR